MFAKKISGKNFTYQSQHWYDEAFGLAPQGQTMQQMKQELKHQNKNIKDKYFDKTTVEFNLNTNYSQIVRKNILSYQSSS